MRRSLAVLAALVLAPVAASAQSVTTRDIVELTKAGLGEEVLLALIEVHRPVFPVDTDTLKVLKDARVPANVIVAMIRSGRELPPSPPVEPVPVAQMEPAPVPAPPPPAQVVVIEHERRYEEPRVREVPVPVYIPVRSRPIVRPEPKPVEPVYWGFGGKLRPDAWKPTAADVQKDAKVPKEPQKK